MSVNKVILVGRLGTDPELRRTKNDFAVVNVRVATNDRKKEGDTWVDHTEWHTVTVWGRQAENLAKYCSKGSSFTLRAAYKRASSKTSLALTARLLRWLQTKSGSLVTEVRARRSEALRQTGTLRLRLPLQMLTLKSRFRASWSSSTLCGTSQSYPRDTLLFHCEMKAVHDR